MSSQQARKSGMQKSWIKHLRYFACILSASPSYQSFSMTSFVGREKSGNHLWTHKEVNFPTSFSMFFFHTKTLCDLGDETFTDVNIEILSAFSDNEGIIFITKNNDINNVGQTNIIRFHRIYRNNWFFLGRYEFRRQNKAIVFQNVFMFQGQFFLYESVGECKRLLGYYCNEQKLLPPKMYLLNLETDKFVEQKLDINYQNFDFFSITI